MKRNKLTLIFLIILFTGCGEDTLDYYPKPNGMLRMEFPDRSYEQTSSICPYTFEMPDYFALDTDTASCHADINIERFNATIYLTYVPLDTTALAAHIEKSRKFAYDHAIKADGIQEQLIMDPRRDTYGLKYAISGNAASLYQFYVTDSVNHFLRGALYFNTKPNYDSIRPSLEYVTEDIDHLIETLNWTD